MAKGMSITVAVGRVKGATEQMVRDAEAGNGAFGVCYARWAQRFRSDMSLRFVKLSRGGGEWPPLRPATIMARMRRPMGRLRLALARGDITQKQFGQRAARAQAKIVREKKRFASGAMRVAILRDTGTLFNALSPTIDTAPGSLKQIIKFGVRVGFGGGGIHPHSKKTIAAIASFHQTGGGDLPMRRILVDPTQRTKQAMAADFAKAAREYLTKKGIT